MRDGQLHLSDFGMKADDTKCEYRCDSRRGVLILEGVGLIADDLVRSSDEIMMRKLPGWGVGGMGGLAVVIWVEVGGDEAFARGAVEGAGAMLVERGRDELGGEVRPAGAMSGDVSTQG